MNENPKRTAAKLKRQISSTMSEVANIQSTARNAKSNPSEYLPLLKGMISSLETYYRKYEDAFEDLFILNDDIDDLNFPSDEDRKNRSIMRNAFYEVKAVYVSLTESSPSLHNSTMLGTLNDTTTVVHDSSSSHLPDIRLEKFDGEILHWPKWRDAFLSIVDEHKSLSSTKKFHFLRSSLTGPALALISKFQLTEANYPLAWKALEDSYDKKRLLATAYLNRVFNFPPFQGKPNFESLRSFTTHVSDSISSFELLKIENESKFILFHLAFRLLDPGTREQFQNAHKDIEFPCFDDLSTFIKDRCLTMQLATNTNLTFDHPSTSKQNQNSSKSKFDKRLPNKSFGNSSFVANESKVSSSPSDSHSNVLCFVCQESSHGLPSCKKFCAADVKQRVAWLKNWKGCRSCLSIKHATQECKSKWNCRWCKQRHNSLICENDGGLNTPKADSGTCCTTSGTYAVTNESFHSQVLLGTCLADVLGANGTYQTVRMVVDSASHFSFMTTKCAKRLGFTPSHCSVKVTGIGGASESVKGFVQCLLKPVSKAAPHLTMKALLLTSITSRLPTVTLPRTLWHEYVKFPLADPKFFDSKPIDILIGADIFAELWLGSPIEINSNSPKLFPTIFGHIVIGKFSANLPECQNENSHGISCIAINQTELSDLNSNLQRFWEIEEPKSTTKINPEDEYCEDHFIQTHYRLEDGSYGVRLPFRGNPPEFEGIESIALRRFRNQENRLVKNDKVREKYHDFMHEYVNLNHMSVSSKPPAFVIPHHHVLKIDRNELKLRVVFDGSAQSQNGSLNEYLMVGPKLQTDIRDVLLNFRVHKIALISDCVKMFRCIWVHPDDRKYQTIYWRFTPFDSLQVYELNTVVYGLTSSPFLANRVVRKIVEDHGSQYPDASKVLLRDIYVDDIVSGCDTIEDAKRLKQQLIDLLGKGNIKLSKWASNEPELLKNVSDTSVNPITITPIDDSAVKILGLQWDPRTDCFGYSLDVPKVKPTKRSILSNVSKTYDPLGFISPLVIKMKKIIQDLWKLGLDWDQTVPNELAADWQGILNELPIISTLKIPRFVRSTEPSIYQVVGFADASEVAYCGALYLRVIAPETIKTTLLTAKTKLAPLKSLTIPRLELCGCLLLVRLYQSIHEFLELLGNSNLMSPLFFTDSTIALGWLRTPTYKLKTFASNRVSEILQVTSEDQWHHVSSQDNPADSGSRGFRPKELLESNLWWHGPTWLSQADSKWALPSLPDSLDLPDIKVEKATLITVDAAAHSHFIIDTINKFSSFNRLLRTMAYVFRFNHNIKKQNLRINGPLKLSELQQAKQVCVKAIQLHHFFEYDLSEKGQAKVMKNFVQLNPFLDSSGVLRAGGRLFNASIPYNNKHPILLPSDSHFTTIIIDHFHRMYLHPGPSILQAVIQLEYWVPSLRRLVRKRVFSCSRCYRLKAKAFIPKMADLPPQRVRATIKAFMKTGLDFAGPFYMKESLRRKSAVYKVYFCIFVCMVTKAIHIEVVSSLSADGFLAALDRFVSLRGHPTDMYSDCGSNFVAAARKLKEWFNWYTSEQTQKEIGEKITVRRITWHFNPPHAPHFGGIWEAGVKSAKSLMIRTVGDVALTFEELATLTAKISAVLNSRPISPLSNDPSETDYLSPGHFLIGEAPLAIPEPSLLDVTMNRLDRWQIVKQMTQHFWHRWHLEYLSTLQKRNKWTKDSINLKEGDLVFLKEDNQPILHWARGRITGLVRGRDGNVRVAYVKTATSTFTRPIAKLVPVFPPEVEEANIYIPPQEEKRRYQQWINGLQPPNESSALPQNISPTHRE